MPKIINRVYILALAIQRANPDKNWMECCELAFQQNRLDNGYN